MEPKREQELKIIGMKIREKALEAVQAANSGHIGGSFSAADILAVLYFHEMKVYPDNPDAQDRDRFVLSKGHCSPLMYAALALRGYFSEDRLKTFRDINSELSGHVEMTKVPGVDMSAGSLGQGLSAAVGMALSAQIYGEDYRVYAMTGDGEIQEGQIWEAVMAAAHYKLDNLMVFVDNNNLQIDGTIEQVMSPYPIDGKFQAFGWNVVTIDGHNPKEIANAIEGAKACNGKPTAVIAQTIKGKGVSFMENDSKWHGKTPDTQQYKQAFQEIGEKIKELEVSHG